MPCNKRRISSSITPLCLSLHTKERRKTLEKLWVNLMIIPTRYKYKWVNAYILALPGRTDNKSYHPINNFIPAVTCHHTTTTTAYATAAALYIIFFIVRKRRQRIQKITLYYQIRETSKKNEKARYFFHDFC